MKTHGGKRPGSGRKPSGRKPYLIRMKPKTMKALKAKAKAKAVGEWLDDEFGKGGSI
jgi:hypothetical protein